MRKWLLAAAALLGLTSSAFAVCPTPLTGKDASNTTQNFGVTVDGGGNCYGNIAIVDGTAAANKAAVNASGQVAIAGPVTNAGTFAVQAAQSGTWNITNISGAISLPTGAATAAGLTTINTTLGSPFQAGGSIGNTSFIATQATGTNLHMVCDSGCSGSGGTSSTFGSAFPSVGTAIGLTNGTNMVAWSATSNYGTAPSAIAVPAVNAFVTGAVGPSIGSAVPNNGSFIGGQARTSEQTATSNTDLIGFITDKVGKLVNLPYANPENFVSGTASATGTGATTLIAAGAGSLKNYITSVQCGRDDAGTTAIRVTFSDANSSVLVLPNNGGGGGNNATYPVPIATAAATAFTFTASAGTTTVRCSAQGYQGV
jgi:hypothetical protein